MITFTLVGLWLAVGLGVYTSIIKRVQNWDRADYVLSLALCVVLGPYLFVRWMQK